MPGFSVLHYLPECAQTHVHWWCHPTNSSSVAPFSSRPQSFPASGSFPMCWLFASGSQSIGTSASASVLPMNIQGWLLIFRFVSHWRPKNSKFCHLVKWIWSKSPLSGRRMIFKKIYWAATGLRWHSGKESASQCKGCGFNPWGRKISWRRQRQPHSSSLAWEIHGQRSQVGSHGVANSWDTTERLSTHAFWNIRIVPCEMRLEYAKLRYVLNWNGEKA